MLTVTPYLLFDGNCREAMAFYKSCFGGELMLMRFADGPEEACCSEPAASADPERIMHACLSGGDINLMASDFPAGTPQVGDHLSLSINCKSKADVDRLFGALGEGGKVTMPLGDTFWGSYFGMLTDKYGFQWMLDHPLPGKAPA